MNTGRDTQTIHDRVLLVTIQTVQADPKKPRRKIIVVIVPYSFVLKYSRYGREYFTTKDCGVPLRVPRLSLVLPIPYPCLTLVMVMRCSVVLCALAQLWDAFWPIASYPHVFGLVCSVYL